MCQGLRIQLRAKERSSSSWDSRSSGEIEDKKVNKHLFWCHEGKKSKEVKGIEEVFSTGWLEKAFWRR